MVQVRDLTELRVEDLWGQVKWQREDWWEEIEASQLRVVKAILEGSLEEEMVAQLQAGRYKRTRSRRRRPKNQKEEGRNQEVRQDDRSHGRRVRRIVRARS